MAVVVSPLFLVGLGVEFGVEELREGLRGGWLDERGVVAVALNELTLGADDPTVVELGCLLSDELDRVREILVVPDRDHSEDREMDAPSRVWQFALLQAVYAQRAGVADPLGRVEELYAAFGYPPEMASFVRYMPLSTGDEPGESALMERWARFLVSERVELGRAVG